MSSLKHALSLILVLLSAFALAQRERPEGWTRETHSNNVSPNYAVVFPQDKVNTITLTIAPEDWQAMQANIRDLLGESGQGGMRRGFAPPAEMPTPPEGFAPPTGFPALGEGGAPPAGFPAAPANFTSENPMWVRASLEFEGQVWTNIGLRYKGNSSLREAWNSGTGKLPLKFDFDEFEDDYPEIHNQRFYGFKQLSFSNSIVDDSFMRDTLMYDLLRAAGLPAAHTAYYNVILDYGEEPVHLGLYVAIEVIDDTVVANHFGHDSGNIYEGDGRAASLAEGTLEGIPAAFLKENNRTSSDWSDIEALYHVLHAPERSSDPQAWRAQLEVIFDVEVFLEWLALSAVAQHWDTYGAMTHNFYLYNNPDTGKLTWISWDHDRVLAEMRAPGAPMGAMPPGVPMGAMPPGAPMGAGRPARPVGAGRQDGLVAPGNRGGMGNVSLGKEEVNANWPLIRYLLDDATYYGRYVGYLETSLTSFDTDRMTQNYERIASLIAPYAAADIGQERFEAALAMLTERTLSRPQAVAAFLANP